MVYQSIDRILYFKGFAQSSGVSMKKTRFLLFGNVKKRHLKKGVFGVFSLSVFFVELMEPVSRPK